MAIKLAVALNFRNYSIDEKLPLLMMVDSSKVATSYMAFQIKEGEIHIIDMDSRVFSGPEMGAPSVSREAMGICYGLRKMEVSIRAHPLRTVLFTDCSSLIFLSRAGSFNSLYFEMSLFLSSFPRLEIVSFPG